MDMDCEALGFDKIKEKLMEFALSDGARRELSALSPFMDEDVCRRKMAETTEARRIYDVLGAPPLAAMKDMDEILTLADTGAMLTPAQLCAAAQFSAACKRLTAYLKRAEEMGGQVAFYGRGITDISEMQRVVEAAVNTEQVFDEASSTLRSVRRKIEKTEEDIKEKLSHILQSRKKYLSESFIAKRGGHYVLPVLRQFQSQFGGTVIEVSGKGGTVFMEPDSVSAMQSELDALRIDEDCECRRILYELTGLICESAAAIRADMDIMETLDFIFAKAKLSAALKAREVTVDGGRLVSIVQGRHPLLKEDACVPLDFRMNGDVSGVIITGPNTGGKTVALKTVGLLTLMAQCGLHIPCGEGSRISMRDAILCDIGDSQDISQNLSTFSGHMTRVIEILQNATPDTLVLLDELGSGTDPAEGMGIAVAVLEELRRRGCMFLVTTHYPEVKTYALSTPGILSARMAFDRESLRPLYRLEMGKTGESCALYIAEKLGMPAAVLNRARAEVYGGEAVSRDVPDMPAPSSRLRRTRPPKKVTDVSGKFTVGDSVKILETGETGIVYRPADKNGDVVVQVKGVKRPYKHNRIELRVPASELYPPDYDFSIIFDTVENRKARHSMDRRFDPNAVITYEEEHQ